MESVQLVNAAHATDDSPVAIGQKRHGLFNLLRSLPQFLFQPVIVVLHNHQLVARTELIFAVKHLVADALIVDVGALVAAGDDDGLVLPHVRIAVGKRLDEFVARHDVDVVESRHPYLRQRGGNMECRGARRFSGGAEASDFCRIPQNARLLTLSQHLAQVAFVYVQSIAAQHVALQCGTVGLADRRQLCAVADEHQPAVTVVVDEADQVVHQLSAGEDGVVE